MKVDTKPFDVNSNYVEPVTLPIGMVGLDSHDIDERQLQDDMSLDLVESTERSIYPKPREDLLDFLLKQGDGNANVAMCLCCNAIFYRKAAMAYEKQKEAEYAKEKQELEKKIAKKEAEGIELNCKLAGKQKMFDFGSFDPSYLKPFKVHPIKQKMKTVVMVDTMLEGMHVKTRVPPTNVTKNWCVQNFKNVSASPMPFPMRMKNKWVRNKNYMPWYFQNLPQIWQQQPK